MQLGSRSEPGNRPRAVGGEQAGLLVQQGRQFLEREALGTARLCRRVRRLFPRADRNDATQAVPVRAGLDDDHVPQELARRRPVLLLDKVLHGDAQHVSHVQRPRLGLGPGAHNLGDAGPHCVRIDLDDALDLRDEQGGIQHVRQAVASNLIMLYGCLVLLEYGAVFGPQHRDLPPVFVFHGLLQRSGILVCTHSRHRDLR